MTILDKILSHKKEEISQEKRSLPLTKIRRLAETAPETKGFFKAVSRPDSRINIIAEVKKASPSKGVIRPDFDPLEIALAYARAGACAISVLTDRHFFQGAYNYLIRIREKLEIPLLMKDFVVDEYQIYKARSIGADAVLLIAAALDPVQLRQYLQLAREISLDALLEVRNERELDSALALNHPLIGINNRDLDTFHADVKTSLKLLTKIPDNITVVSESGIDSGDTCRLLHSRGVKAVLVGEHLMRSDDIYSALKKLLQ